MLHTLLIYLIHATCPLIHVYTFQFITDLCKRLLKTLPAWARVRSIFSTACCTTPTITFVINSNVSREGFDFRTRPVSTWKQHTFTRNGTNLHATKGLQNKILLLELVLYFYLFFILFIFFLTLLYSKLWYCSPVQDYQWFGVTC